MVTTLQIYIVEQVKLSTHVGLVDINESFVQSAVNLSDHDHNNISKNEGLSDLDDHNISLTDIRKKILYQEKTTLQYLFT